MSETFTQTLKKGYRTWIANPPVTIAYILNYIVVMILLFVMAGIFLLKVGISLALNPDLLSALLDGFMTPVPDPASSEAAAEAFAALMGGNILLMIVLFAAFLVLGVLIDVFFTAGISGMIRDAVSSGKCSLNTLVSDGKKYFGVTLGSTILVSILTGVIVLVFAAAVMAVVFLIIAAGPAGSRTGAFLTAFLILALIPLAAVMCLIIYPLSFMVYAPILEGKGVASGASAALSFIGANRGGVLKLSCLFGAVIVCVMFLSFLPLVSTVASLALSFIAAPLFHVWSIRMYMERTGMIPAAAGGGPVIGQAADGAFEADTGATADPEEAS